MNERITLLIFLLLWILPACVPALENEAALKPSTVPPSPTALALIVETAGVGTPDATRPSPTALPAATSSQTATTSPTATNTPSATPTTRPSRTPLPPPTPWPTPANLPAAPRGWVWELHATDIPVTHYIVYEISTDIMAEDKERPYGLDDQPLANIEPLPRTFLVQTAYQGSGRLPNGDILQYAAVRPAVERGLVPFRYLITPARRCDGHPLAGNGTCSVPLKTAATTWREGEEPIVPVGSTIFIPELNMKIRINDVAISDGPSKIDLYTGTTNNYDYERPDGATIWILAEE